MCVRERHPTANPLLGKVGAGAVPVLTGIRLELDGDKVTLAATDRYRLAVRELCWSPEHTGLESVALVPARTLAETAKALGGCESVDGGAGPFEQREGLVGFDGGGRRTTTRLLEGEFPKYRSLLPPSPPAWPTSTPARWSRRSSGSPSWPSAIPRCG